MSEHIWLDLTPQVVVSSTVICVTAAQAEADIISIVIIEYPEAGSFITSLGILRDGRVGGGRGSEVQSY